MNKKINLTIKCPDGKFKYNAQILDFTSYHFSSFFHFKQVSIKKENKIIFKSQYPVHVLKLLLRRFINMKTGFDDLTLDDLFLIFDIIDEYLIKINIFKKGLISNYYGETGIIAELQLLFLEKIRYENYFMIMSDVFKYSTYNGLKEIIQWKYFNQSLFPLSDTQRERKIKKYVCDYMKMHGNFSIYVIGYNRPFYSPITYSWSI